MDMLPVLLIVVAAAAAGAVEATQAPVVDADAVRAMHTRALEEVRAEHENSMRVRGLPPAKLSRRKAFNVSETDVQNSRSERRRVLLELNTPQQVAASEKQSSLVPCEDDVRGRCYTGVDFISNALVSRFFNIPPDTHAAVGPRHLLHVVNTHYIVTERDSGKVLVTEDFYDLFVQSGVVQAVLTAFGQEQFVLSAGALSFFDPKAAWDPYEQRFVMIVLGSVGRGDVAIFIAASRTDDLRDGFHTTAVDARRTIMVDDGNGGFVSDFTFFDFPYLAVTDDAVIITGNQFPNFDFPFPEYFVLLKADLYDRSTLFVPQLNGQIVGGVTRSNKQLELFIDDVGNFRFSMAPARQAGPRRVSQAAAAPRVPVRKYVGYLAYYNAGFDFDEQSFFLTIDALPGVRALDNLDVQSFKVMLGSMFDNFFSSFSSLAPSGTFGPLATANERRALDAVMRTDCGHKLWVATYRELVTDAGVSYYESVVIEVALADDGTPLVDDVRVLAPRVLQALSSSPDTAPVHSIYPSVAVNDKCQIAMGVSTASDDFFPSAHACSMDADDSQFTNCHVIRSGEAPYFQSFGVSTDRNRWGDYSSTTVDPADGETFFTAQMYAATNGGPVFDLTAEQHDAEVLSTGVGQTAFDRSYLGTELHLFRRDERINLECPAPMRFRNTPTSVELLFDEVAYHVGLDNMRFLVRLAGADPAWTAYDDDRTHDDDDDDDDDDDTSAERRHKPRTHVVTIDLTSSRAVRAAVSLDADAGGRRYVLSGTDTITALAAGSHPPDDILGFAVALVRNDDGPRNVDGNSLATEHCVVAEWTW